MSHQEQRDYCQNIKRQFPEFFKNKKVIDFGSLDINGSNRELFEDCDYTGLDIGPGKNVDIVCKAHEYDAPDASYDVVCSTEMFEHDKHLALSLPNMIRVLKRGGFFFFTCAAPGRAEHGTRRSDPGASPMTTATDDEWADFYRNIDESIIREIIDVDAIFSEYKFSVVNTDLQFFGIKKYL